MKYFFRVLLTDRRDFLLQNKAIYDKFRDFAWNRSPTPVHVLHTRKIQKTKQVIVLVVLLKNHVVGIPFMRSAYNKH